MTKSAEVSLVSVIIPAYNAELTVARAIQSVLEDQHPRKEILVVDDGSTDATLTVARQFIQCDQVEVRVIALPHGGANRARNTGLREARGRYVQFLDADDWLINHKLARSVELFEEDASGSKVVHLVYSGEESPSAVNLAANEFSLFTHGLNTAAAMWRRDYLIKAGLLWDETLDCWQEAEYFFRALVNIGGRERLRHLPGAYYVRERTATGISSRYFSEAYIITQNKAIDKIYRYCQTLPCGSACVDHQYYAYKKSLLMRSVVCHAPLAWQVLSDEILQLPVGMQWKSFARVPYPMVRGLYCCYRAVKKMLGMAK